MLVIRRGWGACTILIVAVVTIAVGAIVQLLPGALGYPRLAFLAASTGLLEYRSSPVALLAFVPLLALPSAIRV